MRDKKKPIEDDDDEEGIFTGQDYKEVLGFDPFASDDTGEEDSDEPDNKARTKKAKKSDPNASHTGARTVGKSAKYRKTAKKTK